MIELSVFLGNPGQRYARTRHNIGMRLGEAFAERHALQFQRKFGGRLAAFRPSATPAGAGSPSSGAPAWTKLLLLLPETYMNRSGESVGACARYHEVDPPAILVAHDEVELPFGPMELRRGGGLAGHNGLRSVSQHLSARNYARLRLGIGRPPRGDVSSHVLGNFSPDEENRMDDLSRAVEEILERLAAAEFDSVAESVGRSVVFE